MHATFQELLNLRDDPVADAVVSGHVADCVQCAAELEYLRQLKLELRSLPQYPPPRHVWRSIRDELERSPRRRVNKPVVLAAAATLLIAGVLAVLQLKYADPLPRTAATLAPAPRDPEALQRLVDRSQQLEDLLQRLPPRPSVERAATSAAIDDLQTRIQVLDMQLDALPRSAEEHRQAQALWSRRVQLLHSLIDVRYAEAVRDGDESFNSRYSGVI
jgi:hypothetical protein